MKVKELQDAYDKAVEKKAETFWFGDKEFVVGYAKYLLQYLKEIKRLNDDDEITFTSMVGFHEQ